MPYIETTTNVTISAQQEQLLKEQLGQAISLISGKSEAFLMLSFRPGTPMYFSGDNAPALIALVSSFGSVDAEEYAVLTRELTAIFTKNLPVASERVYIKYDETNHWGWNGGNF